MKRRLKILAFVLIFCCTVCLETPLAQRKIRTPTANGAKAIDDAALRNADARAGEWITHGRNYSETRFSPLSQINAANVKQLGLAWSFDTGTTRGLEATPIVTGGVMYTTGSWSVVFALDARTGKLLWKWDPQVPRTVGQKACCDVVNRGAPVIV